MMNDIEPKVIGGFGKIWGTEYRQGNRVYDSSLIAVALSASPTGNMGGYTSLYLVRESVDESISNMNDI